MGRGPGRELFGGRDEDWAVGGRGRGAGGPLPRGVDLGAWGWGVSLGVAGGGISDFRAPGAGVGVLGAVWGAGMGAHCLVGETVVAPTQCSSFWSHVGMCRLIRDSASCGLSKAYSTSPSSSRCCWLRTDLTLCISRRSSARMSSLVSCL